MDPHIFRAYDIRGDVRTQLTPEAVYAIGCALGVSHFPPGSTLAIGHDARTHSPLLAQKLMDGLRTQGINVVYLHSLTTPMFYFSLHRRKLDGGVMVTGSHNPRYDNGLKICRATESFLRADIEAIRAAISLPLSHASVYGTFFQQQTTNAYVHSLKKHVPPPEKPFLRIVLDCGNGIAGCVAKRVIAEYASEVIPLYCEPDGTFPNHHPDPSDPANLEDCRQTVLSHGAHLGIAFDGDGDRIGVIDTDGSVIPADQLCILFAREILARRPGSRILADVKCSNVLFREIAQCGGIPEMCRTGHALIKQRMRETGAAMAGEMSGHFFFLDRWFGFDDALYAALRLIEIVSDSALHNGPSTVRGLLGNLPKTFTTPEIRIPCPDGVKFDVVRDVAGDFSKRYPTNELDGARIDFPNGWALIRASNTQPMLVMRVEADTSERLENIRSELHESVQRHASKRGASILQIE